MELVRGSSLEAWGARVSWNARRASSVRRDLRRASTAHAQGIVHGDLKPGNVLLTTDGRMKLTDFGIAHVIDPLRNPERRGVQGTPYYMAPEQLVDLESIGPSTDLYADRRDALRALRRQGAVSVGGHARRNGRAKDRADRAALAAQRRLDFAALRDLVTRLLEPDPRIRPRFAAQVRASSSRSRASSSCRASCRRSSSGSRSRSRRGSTRRSAASRRSRRRTSSRNPTSTRSLPFTLPCVAGATPEVALHRLRPLPLFGRSEQTAGSHRSSTRSFRRRTARAHRLRPRGRRKDARPSSRLRARSSA